MYKYHLFILLVLLGVMPLHGQVSLTDSLPFDPDYRVGKLDNGLTYYIKENARPANRAELWLLVHAGSMQEEPDQNGLAHYVEHMAFNGTDHFPDKGIIDFLQGIGMEFGPDINAWTSYNETVYTLTNVPVEDPAYIDTSMNILSDWARYVSFLDEEVELERGVIREEWRSRNSSMSRIRDSINEVLYEGSKYANHNVIGDIDVINDAPPQRLRDFYQNWYRPDLQAVVIIGDVDTDMVEAKIKEYFDYMEVPEEALPRKEQHIPDHEETKYVILTDPEATSIRLQYYYKHDRRPPNRTYGDMREGLVRSLGFSMINERISERSQKEEDPMSYGFWNYGNLMPEKAELRMFASPRDGKVLQVVTLMQEEMHRALQHGFTEAELEEIKTILMRDAQRSVLEKDTRRNRRLCFSARSAFFNDMVILSPEDRYAFYQQVVDGITTQEIHEAIKPLMIPNNRVVSLSGPENADLPTAREIEERVKAAEEKTYHSYETFESIVDLLPVKPEPGKILKTEAVEEPEFEKWTLSNGMIVYVKFADFDEDEFSLQMTSYGGSSLHELEAELPLRVAIGAARESGLGEATSLQLTRYMRGKQGFAAMSSGLYTDMGYVFGGSIRYLEDNLKWLHLAFTQPRIDRKGYNKYMARQESFYKNRHKNPRSLMSDSMRELRNDGHPRMKVNSWEDFEKMEYGPEMLELYKERFDNPGRFKLFLVGNFNREELKEQLEAYVASIPGEAEESSFRDLGIRPINTRKEKTMYIPMVTPKANVNIEFFGEIEDTHENAVLMGAVTSILRNSMRETIREDEGGTYGVRTGGSISDVPVEEYFYYVSFETDPERVDELKELVYLELDSLRNGHVKERYLEEYREAYRKGRSENLEEPRTWISMMSAYAQNQPVRYTAERDQLVESITLEQVVEFANRILNEDRMLDVVFLPMKEEQQGGGIKMDHE